MSEQRDKFGPKSALRRGDVRRAGSVYLLALGVSTLIALIGLTALTTVRINQRAARQGGARAAAQSLAMSAVEHALTVLDATPQWRTIYIHNVETAQLKLGEGTMAWKLIDEFDKDLSDDQSQPARIVGIGRSGEAMQMYSVEILPRKTPVSCLESCLHGNGTIAFSGAFVQADQLVSTNNSMNAVSAVIDAPVEAVTQITGASYNLSRVAGVAPRDMPDPIRVFDHYLNSASAISLAGLPLDSAGCRVLERMVIGAAQNPLGLANPRGIYVVQCAGEPIIIRNCRIAATLILLDPGVNSRIESSVCWEAAAPNYPALMVRGSIDIRTIDTPLSESSGGSNVNYNPPGVPYAGSEDSDTSDEYPSLIRGLVYMTEKLINNTNGIDVEGTIVVGQTTNVAGSMNIRYRREIYQDPPPGFFSLNKVSVVPRSWRQEVQ